MFSLYYRYFFVLYLANYVKLLEIVFATVGTLLQIDTEEMKKVFSIQRIYV